MKLTDNAHPPLRGERLYQSEVHRDGSQGGFGREYWGASKQEILSKLATHEALLQAKEPRVEDAVIPAEVPPQPARSSAAPEPRPLPSRIVYGDPARVVTGESNRPIVPR